MTSSPTGTDLYQYSRLAPSRLAFAVMAILGLICCGLYFAQIVPDTIETVGIILVLITILPWIIYVWDGKLETVPFLPVVGTFYTIFFAFPIYLAPLGWSDYSSIILYGRVAIGEVRSEVLWLIVFSLCACWMTYYLATYLLKGSSARFWLPSVQSAGQQKSLFYILLIAHLFGRLFPELAAIGSINQFLEPAGYVGLGGFYFLWRRKELTKRDLFLLLAAILPLEIYLRIRILFITDILLLGLFLILLLWKGRQFRLIAVLALTSLIIISSYSATGPFRSGIDHGVEKIVRAAKIYLHLYILRSDSVDTSVNKIVFSEGRFGSLVKRISHVWVFHAVADKSPEPIPFWDGYSYRGLLYMGLPRLLFPDKPEERVGGEFGHRYGFLDSGESSSVNLPWIIELLANFGAAGVVAGMGLIGVFLAFIAQLIDAQRNSFLEFTVALSLLFPLAYQESNLSVMTGTLLLQYFAFVFYFRIGRKLLPSFSKNPKTA